ncbi:MAG: oligosaccharide flippase family protein [Balneolaceae bacterium]
MHNLTSKAFWILFSDGGAKLFGFFTTIYLARTLGAEQYGLIALALSILGVCSWFSDLGIQTLATRSVASTPPEERNPAQFFWMKVTLSLLVLSVSAAAVWILLANQPVLRILVLLFILSLFPQSLQLDWYYNGIQEFKYVTASKWVQGAVYLGGLVLFVAREDLYLVPVVYAVSILAGASVMLLSYRGEHSLLQHPAIEKWPADIRNSFFLGAGHFMAQSIILLPPIAIGFFLTETDVGYYSVSMKLVLAIMLADRIISTLLLSNLPRLRSEQPEAFQDQLEIVCRWMVVLGSMGTIFLAFSAGWIIPFLFGNEYASSISVLQILSFVLPVTFLNTVFTYGLISLGRDREFMRATLYGGLATTLLIIVSGFTSQLILMVAAVVLGEIIITFTIYKMLQSFQNISLWSFLLVSIALLTGIILPGIYLDLPSLLMLPAGLILYPGLLLLSRSLTLSDLRWMKRRVTQ